MRKLYLRSPDLGLPRKAGGCLKEGDVEDERERERKREIRGIRDVQRNNETQMNQAEQTKPRGLLGILIGLIVRYKCANV